MISISLTSRLLGVAICALSVLAGASLAMDELSVNPSASSSSSSSSSLSSSSSQPVGPQQQQQQQQNLLHGQQRYFAQPAFGMPGGKRAYSYRSEYKRLPLYQFGLGKRMVQGFGDKRAQPYSFGLGKRAKQYAFGLGKRGGGGYGNEELVAAGMNRMSGAPSSAAVQSLINDAYAQKVLEHYLESKRSASAGGFNFGLGKRDTDLGSILRDYDFQDRLPIKHSRDNLRYQFGLGKRDDVDPSQELDEIDDDGVEYHDDAGVDEDDSYMNFGASRLV